MSTITENLRRLEEEIVSVAGKCGRKREEIELIGVSKLHPVSDVIEAAEAGLSSFGESYPQEFRDKIPQIEALLPDSGLRMHFIGSLQRNKVKYVVGKAVLIHSVDTVKLAKEIDRKAKEEGGVQDILVQVNISGEGSKSGAEPQNLPEILDGIKGMGYIRCIGLMGMSGLGSSRDERRGQFALLRKLRDKCNQEYPQVVELSMGMSEDFQLAIEEGSTMLRIGSTIFGSRVYEK